MDRIRTLDGFRAISIILVLFYHYFSRWIPPFTETYVNGYEQIYPYGDQFNYFKYGNAGVVFFFMISGFVIVMTLEKTKGLGIFLKNRIIRLLPTMIFISLITFFIFKLLGSSTLFYEKNTSLKNLITSITFINPKIYNQLPHTQVDWLNGSYWSLWPEIQFYLLSGILFYFLPGNKLNNLLLIFCALLLIDTVVSWEEKYIHAKSFEHMIGVYHHETKLFNILAYLPSFGLGVVWYRAYKDHSNFKNIPTILVFLILLSFQLSSKPSISEKLLYLGFNAAFALLVFAPQTLSFLNNRVFQIFGIGSYALYLLHEQVGVAFITKMPSSWSPIFQAIIVIAMMLIFGLASYYYTIVIEKNIIKIFKQKRS